MDADGLIEFENAVEQRWFNGELPYLFHLSGGNERELLRVFEDFEPGDYVLSTHRSHYHYLLAGGSPDDLMAKILDGKSMFVFDRKLNFLTSSVLAGMCGIAAGIALALQRANSTRIVWCFVGDGAADQGHLYEAVKYVESLSLPCRFIIEDNDRSCDSSRRLRGADADVLRATCLGRYSYIPTHPHCQSGDQRPVTFRTGTQGNAGPDERPAEAADPRRGAARPARRRD